MSGSPINLNRARKARERAREKLTADANALKYGRTRAQKRLEATRNEKARRDLDALKRET